MMRGVIGGLAILAAFVLFMYCAIWIGAKLALRAMRWADERDEREEAERSG